MDDEEFVTCPYNKYHRIRKSRIQHHLIKCEETGPKLAICPFNATHRYPEQLIKDHCTKCPDNMSEEYQLYKPQTETVGALTKPKPLLQKDYLPEHDPESEYWD